MTDRRWGSRGAFVFRRRGAERSGATTRFGSAHPKGYRRGLLFLPLVLSAAAATLAACSDASRENVVTKQPALTYTFHTGFDAGLGLLKEDLAPTVIPTEVATTSASPTPSTATPESNFEVASALLGETTGAVPMPAEQFERSLVVLVLDSETDAPIGGVVVSGRDQESTTNAEGLAEAFSGQASPQRVSLSHPGYLPTFDTIGETVAGNHVVYMRPRRSETFAEVRAGEATTLNLANGLELEFAEDSLQPGTVLQIGVADEKTIRQADGEVFEGDLVPQVRAQLQVNVVGQDPWEFHHVVNPDQPVKMRVALSEADLLSHQFGGTELYLAAGSDLERVSEEDFVIHENPADGGGTLELEMTHFSDAIVAHRFRVVPNDNCEEFGFFLEFVHRRPFTEKLTRKHLHTNTAFCTDEATPTKIDLSAAVTVSSEVEISASARYRFGRSQSVGLYAGTKIKGKIPLAEAAAIALEGESLHGYVGKSSSTSGSGSQVRTSFAASQTFQIDASAACVPGWNCQGELDGFFQELEVEYNRIVFRVDDLLEGSVPVFTQSCLGHGTGPVAGTKASSSELRSFGKCLQAMVSGDILGASRSCTPRQQREIQERLDQVSATDGTGRITTVTAPFQGYRDQVRTRFRRFLGAALSTYAVPDSCLETPPLDPPGPRPPQEGELSDRPPICLETDPPRPPRPVNFRDSIREHYARPFSLAPRPIALDGSAAQAEVSATLTEAKTEELRLEELARVGVCCDRPGTQTVSVSHVAKVKVTDRQTGQTASGSHHGYGTKSKAFAGLELGPVTLGAVGAVQSKTFWGADSMLGEALAHGNADELKVKAVASVTVAPNENVHRVEGVFAYLYQTTYKFTLHFDVAGVRTDKEYDVEVIYFGAPLSAPELTIPGYCAPPEPPSIPFNFDGGVGPLRPDGGLQIDAGVPLPPEPPPGTPFGFDGGAGPLTPLDGSIFFPPAPPPPGEPYGPYPAPGFDEEDPEQLGPVTPPPAAPLPPLSPLDAGVIGPSIPGALPH